jgi:hypothetical protein
MRVRGEDVEKMLKIREKDEEIVVRTQYSSHAPLVVME